MSNVKKDKLKENLKQISRKINHSMLQQSNEKNIDLSDKSKENLCAFLALHSIVEPDINRQLIEEGFLPLDKSSAHILYSLQKILTHLGETFDVNLDYLDTLAASQLRDERSNRLFGQKQNHPHIMVTLDKSMLQTPEVFYELIQSGMTVARINCAHDDESVWKELIHVLRDVEANLNKEGTNNYKTKIYIDLPGPKIRINRIVKRSASLTIACKNNESIGYIVNNPKLMKKDFGSFMLYVDNITSFQNIQEGERIYFLDARYKKRYFRVLEKGISDWVKVELNKSAVLNETVILLPKGGGRWYISEAKNLINSIDVKKGDLLRIYKDVNHIGKTKDNGSVASFGVTLPKALRNVRVGDRVYIDDGRIHATVVAVTKGYIEVKIILNRKKVEEIKMNKGINFPDSLIHLSVPTISEIDIGILKLMYPYIDLVGISFINHPHDIQIIKQHLFELTDRRIGIIGKIETKTALLHLSNIILEGLDYPKFGVMIARGDLAVEIGMDQLAKAQQGILEICYASHIPVIWATGVLNKMNKSNFPQVAELTDANLALKADCIMLNKGPFVPNSVEFIQKLNEINKDPMLENRYSLVPFTQFGFSQRILK